jgi:hypothetical protein
MFIENKFLVHVDLSFNKIEQFETEIIARDIAFNQTCVGFHYAGNKGNLDKMYAKVDSLGQMRMIDVFYQKITDKIGIPDGSPMKKKIIQRKGKL